jgi:ankyrin repeat protein
MKKLKYILVIIGLIFSLSVQAEEELLDSQKEFLVSANDCDIPTLQKHIDNGINLDVLTWNDKFGMTASMLTSLSECHVGFDILINAGADVNVQSYENGYTVLIRSIIYGNVVFVEKLVNHPNIDFTITDVKGRTPLAVAMDQFQLEVDSLLYVNSLTENNKETHSEFYIQTLVKWRLLSLDGLEKSGKIIALLLDHGAK